MVAGGQVGDVNRADEIGAVGGQRVRAGAVDPGVDPGGARGRRHPHIDRVIARRQPVADQVPVAQAGDRVGRVVGGRRRWWDRLVVATTTTTTSRRRNGQEEDQRHNPARTHAAPIPCVGYFERRIRTRVGWSSAVVCSREKPGGIAGSVKFQM